MGQILQADSIGALSHSSGVITLQASLLTIGGQQYVTASINRTISTDVTLVGNTLYMIYAVVSGGTVQLRISSNVNSIGPAGFTAWKLVGAFYSNANFSTAFGSFVNIEGVPESDWIPFQTTGSWTSNVGHSGLKKRKGTDVSYQIQTTISGAPGPAVPYTVNIPDTMDAAKIKTTQTYMNLGSMACLAAGNAHGALEVGYQSSTSVSGWAMNQSAASGHNYSQVSPTVPMTFQNADFVDSRFTVPIVGLTNTPLKDL